MYDSSPTHPSPSELRESRYPPSISKYAGSPFQSEGGPMFSGTKTAPSVTRMSTQGGSYVPPGALTLQHAPIDTFLSQYNSGGRNPSVANVEIISYRFLLNEIFPTCGSTEALYNPRRSSK